MYYTLFTLYIGSLLHILAARLVAVLLYNNHRPTTKEQKTKTKKKKKNLRRSL